MALKLLLKRRRILPVIDTKDVVERIEKPFLKNRGTRYSHLLCDLNTQSSNIKQEQICFQTEWYRNWPAEAAIGKFATLRPEFIELSANGQKGTFRK